MFGLCKGFYLPIDLRYQLRMFLGLYEREVRKSVESLVNPGMCCFDVGAAIGYYTLALSRLASPGRVYAFEADESRYRLLRDAVSRNSDIGSEVRILNFFVGNLVDLKRRMVTIDYLVFEEKYQAPDFVKIDVEGSELEVLAGARKVIKVFSPKFVMEVHSEELERSCGLLLEKQGYKVIILDRSKFLPEYRPILHNRWLCAVKQI